MDRRAVFAFILMFLVFIAWSKIYVALYGPDDDDAAARTEQAAPAEEGSAPITTSENAAASSQPVDPDASRTVAASTRNDTAAPAAAPSGGFIAPESTPGMITVSTSLYDMVIDPRGGRVVGWIGHAFPDPDGTPLQLIPQVDQDFERGDALIFRGGVLELGGAVFTASSLPATGPQRIVLDDQKGEYKLELIAISADGFEIRKLFTFRPGSYEVPVSYSVVAAPGADPAALARFGDPLSARFRWADGLNETEAKSGSAFARGQAGFRAFAKVGDDVEFKNRRDLEGKAGKGEGLYEGSVRMAGVQSKYFMIAGIVPGSEQSAIEGRIRLGGDRDLIRQSWEIEVPLRPDDSGAIGTASLLTYFGPSDYHLLREYGNGLHAMVNLGWKWIQPISELMLWLMNWLHGFIPNFGWVIVIISILSKLVFYPLTSRGTKSMRNMQVAQARLKPKLDAAKEKFGKDPQRYNQEMMKIYKEEGVNPMAGMAGCLPMLVQMPVFIALYQVLYNMIDLRQAPFIFWIQDLSQPDALFTLPFSLPFLGSHFNLLPIIMGAVTYFQTKMTPTAGTPSQMASMNTIMPIMMLFLLYNMPSGLVIYWTINTAVTAYQTWMIHRSAPKAEGA